MEDRSSGINLNEFSTADHDMYSNNFSYVETENEILRVTVELPDGKKAQVAVHDNESLDQLVSDFGKKHDLGPKARAALTEQIEKTLQVLYPDPSSRLPESIENESIKFEIPNKGHELYMKGVKMREKVKQKTEAIKNEYVAKEMKSTTFRPSTNSPGRRPKPPEQLLLEKGKKTLEILEKKRTERDKKALDPCTFSPEINKNAEHVKKSPRKSPERFVNLYKDAQSIREKLIRKSNDLVKKDCPFEPNFDLTRKKTNQLVKKSPIKDKGDDKKNCVYIINSPEKTKQHKQNPNQNIICPGHKSEQMIQKIRRTRYEEIFNDLLPDTKGVITRETVYKAKLQQKLKDMIKPLIEEIEQNDEKLNFNNFCDAMEILMKTLSQGEKTELMRMPKNASNDDFDFAAHKQASRANSSVGGFSKNFVEEMIRASPSKNFKSLHAEPKAMY